MYLPGLAELRQSPRLLQDRFPSKKECRPLLQHLRGIPKVDHHVHLTCAISERFLAGEFNGKTEDEEIKKKLEARLQDPNKPVVSRNQYLHDWARDDHLDTPKLLRLAIANAVATILESDQIVGFGLRLNPMSPIKLLGKGPYSLSELETTVATSLEWFADAAAAPIVQERGAQVRLIPSFNRGKENKIVGYNNREAVIAAMGQLHRSSHAGLIGGIDISGPEYAVKDKGQSPQKWGEALRRVLQLGWAERFLVTVHLGDPSNRAGKLEELKFPCDREKYYAKHYRYFRKFLDVIIGLKMDYPEHRFRIGHGYLLSPYPLLAPRGLQDKLLPPRFNAEMQAMLQDIIANDITMEVCPAVTARKKRWDNGAVQVSRYRNLPLFYWLGRGVKVVLGTDSLFTTTSASLSENVLRLLLAMPEVDAEKIMAMVIKDPGLPAHEFL